MANLLYAHPWIIMIILVWSLPWKGAALWKSARKAHVGWFIVLLIVNTLGILDIIYIFFVSDWENKKKIEQNDQDYQRKLRTYNPKMIM